MLKLTLLFCFGYLTSNYLYSQNKSMYSTESSSNYLIVRKDIPNKYCQSIRLSSGISFQAMKTNMVLRNYADTSDQEIENDLCSPLLNISHSLQVGNRLLFEYQFSYGQNKIELNRNSLSTHVMSLFLKPTLDLVRKPKFSCFIALNFGVVYNDIKVHKIIDECLSRLMSPTYKLYTGFSPIGLRFNISSQMQISSNISFWSYETFSIGLQYKFCKNYFHPDFAVNP